MYYDRRIPESLLNLLLPDAPLGWLMHWLRGDAAGRAGAHIQTRKDRDARSRGAIQLYLGRTSPLEVQGGPSGRLRLSADPSYQLLSPGLFEQIRTPADLAARSKDLQAHIDRAISAARRSFLDGEAVAHAGLMRRYGPLALLHPPFWALDSEVRLGFDSRAQQQGHDDALRARIGLPAAEELPQKLDLLGLDKAGALLLVEVKKDARGLGRAAWQAAAHVARFESLLAEQPDWPQEVLLGLIQDKHRVGLLGKGVLPAIQPRLVPVLAAPDARPDWAAAWRNEIARVQAGRWLDGLRLWRLGEAGELLDEA